VSRHIETRHAGYITACTESGASTPLDVATPLGPRTEIAEPGSKIAPRASYRRSINGLLAVRREHSRHGVAGRRRHEPSTSGQGRRRRHFRALGTFRPGSDCSSAGQRRRADRRDLPAGRGRSSPGARATRTAALDRGGARSRGRLGGHLRAHKPSIWRLRGSKRRPLRAGDGLRKLVAFTQTGRIRGERRRRPWRSVCPEITSRFWISNGSDAEPLRGCR
jgi:hypothetical protein